MYGLMYRIGHGYDVHKFEEGRKLILCGVDICYEKGLLGHSDADVALHAISDALLGALALGDIGKHFPDNDERYRGISSMILLENVYDIVCKKGYKLVNVDVTISAQAPKLAPYIEEMRLNISGCLHCDIDDVSVKATTTEGLGFEGRKEGISATSVCLLKKA